MYWRVNKKRKSQWSMRWLGPGIARQLEILFGLRKWKNNFRGMISAIPYVTQMNRHTLISVRLVRPVIPSMKVNLH